MACTGHNGTTPNYAACPGYIPPVAAYAFTTPDLLAGVHGIEDYHFNQIREAVAQEITRRGLSWAAVGGDPGVVTQGSTLVTGYNWRVMRNNINAMRAFTINYSSNAYMITAQPVRQESIEELRAAINLAKAQCACQCNYGCTCDCNYCTCNCNYCTCNCNYCTCNCNYCTCNCNYCTCNCNYACVCNCNYSDVRLKKDIEYL